MTCNGSVAGSGVAGVNHGTADLTGSVIDASKLGTDPKLELKFEYLMSADKMQWITVVSGQAILMSLCLQSMVEELVRLKSGERDPMRLTRCTSNRHSKNKINIVKVKNIYDLNFYN
jgi:hypothetical protein